MKNDNIYQMVTDRIIAEMEKGIIPWQKPWNGGECCISHTTGKPYSWLNQLMLGGKVGKVVQILLLASVIDQDDVGESVLQQAVNDRNQLLIRIQGGQNHGNVG